MSKAKQDQLLLTLRGETLIQCKADGDIFVGGKLIMNDKILSEKFGECIQAVLFQHKMNALINVAKTFGINISPVSQKTEIIKLPSSTKNGRTKKSTGTNKKANI